LNSKPQQVIQSIKRLGL